MKIVVTGASGYLGSNLSRVLKDLGHDVMALTRSPSPILENLGVEIFVGEKRWSDAFEIRPEAVCNLAGAFTPDLSKGAAGVFDANFGFPKRILEMARRSGVQRWLQAGTYWQYNTDGQVWPVNTYAALKQAFMDQLEAVSELSDLKVTNLVLYDVYGPNDWRNKLIPSLLKAVPANSEFPITAGEQTVSFVHLNDVLSAFQLCLDGSESTRCETFFVHNEAKTLKDFILQFQEISNGRPQLKWGVRPYDVHHIINPYFGPRPPGWTPTIGFSQGIEELLNE